MKVLKNAVLYDSKKLPIAIIILGVFSLLISIFSITVDFSAEGTPLIIEFSNWASVISVIPLTWCVSTALLLKTQKVIFAKMPAYIICALISVAYILYVIATGEGNVSTQFVLLTVIILLLYPFVIAVLTIEGRVYNRVFATVFTSILIFICAALFVVLSLYFGSVSLSLLIPLLTYTKLLLLVFCYRLEPLKKKSKSEYDAD